MGNFFVPAMVFLVVLAIVATIAVLARRYIRVGPNECAVIFGRKRTIFEVDAAGTRIKKAIGFRTVCGGATFILPILEKVEYMDLTEMNIPVSTAGAITKFGVPLTVEAIANVKIGSDEVSLRNAAERLLGKPEPEVQEIVKKTLEAHLRSICGTLTIEEINSDRQAFSQKVTSEAAEDLKKLGLIIDMIPVQHLQDTVGYLEALGRKKTQEVKRDAEIGVAQAQRESTIQSTDAHREGEVRNQSNIAQEKEAAKETNVKVAQYSAEVNAASAKASQAGPLAEATAKQDVVKQQVKVEEVKVQAEIAVEEQHILREQRNQEAVTVVPAKAKADAAIRESEGQKQAAINMADGERSARIARAEAKQKELEAEANGQAAMAKQIGEAQAAATRAKLLAEAEGVQKIAEAYNEFSDKARFLKILELMPPLLEKMGPIMAAVTAPLGNVDRITMIDGGGNGTDGKGSLMRLASFGPRFLDDLSKTCGVDISGLLKKFGIAVSEPGTSSK